MDRLERIKRYEAGESIYSIAKLANVSRQSVMRSLDRAGVYSPGDRLVGGESVSIEPMVGIKSTVGVPFSIDDLNKEPDKKGNLGKNLRKVGTGYQVFDFKRGGWLSYVSVQDIFDQYNINV